MALEKSQPTDDSVAPSDALLKAIDALAALKRRPSVDEKQIAQARAKVIDLITPESIQSSPTTGATPLGRAARSGEAKLIAAMLAQGAKPNVKDNQSPHATPLIYATQAKNPECMELLLANGAHPNMPNSEKITPADVARCKQFAAGEALIQKYEGIRTGLKAFSLWAKNNNFCSENITTHISSFLCKRNP